MSTTLTITAGTAASQRSAITEPPWVRRALIALALAFLAAFLLLPLVVGVHRGAAQRAGHLRRGAHRSRCAGRDHG